jgi:hypothetical protein
MRHAAGVISHHPPCVHAHGATAAQGARAKATVDSCLSRWRRQGRITRVKQGVFVRLDGPGAENGSRPDFVTLASRMAPDAAAAYHMALEVHGCAQSLFERFTFVDLDRNQDDDLSGSAIRARAPAGSAHGRGRRRALDRAGGTRRHGADYQFAAYKRDQMAHCRPPDKAHVCHTYHLDGRSTLA